MHSTMNVRKVLDWLREYVHNYNLFLLDEDEHNDDDEKSETSDAAFTDKRQRYATRLYVPLITGK